LSSGKSDRNDPPAGGWQEASEWGVRAARLIDGTGRAPIEKALLVVQGERVAAVGPASELKPPPGLPVLDLGDETVLPGLIDTHNHLSLRPIGQDFGDYFSQFYDPESLVTARSVRHLRVDLLTGVTTVRVVGELDFVDVKLGAAVDEGLIAGPRIVPSGPRLGPWGGHVWIPQWSVGGAANIRHTIREYVARGARLIKLGLLDETQETTSYSDEELTAAVDEAHGLGVPVAAHCTGLWGSSIRHSLENGVDCIEHVVPLNEEMLELFVKSGAAMSLTPFAYRSAQPQPVSYWQFEKFGAKSAKEWADYNAKLSEEFLRAHPEMMTENRYFGREVFPALGPRMEIIRQAWKAGVPLAVGSDAPHGVLSLSVEFLVQCGLSPLEALTAATGVAAKIARIEDETGTLTAGKAADFLSVPGNPAENIKALRNVHLIARKGRRFDGLSFA
jgi:imidazolonepropionase-like amidohydrolase